MAETATAAARGTRVTYDFVTRAIARTLGHPGKGYFALLAAAVRLRAVRIVCLLFLLLYGLWLAGYWHSSCSSAYSTCFGVWVGIAYSRPLIPAVLFPCLSGG